MHDKRTNCQRCGERQGVRRLSPVDETGLVLPDIWYCEPCYQYLRQKAAIDPISTATGHFRTRVISEVPPQLIEIPGSPHLPYTPFDKPPPSPST